MQFLITTSRRHDAPADVIAAGLPAEVARVKLLYSEGVIRQIWHRADRGGAVILAESESLGQISGILAALPLAEAGVVTIDEIVPLRAYAGFAEQG